MLVIRTSVHIMPEVKPPFKIIEKLQQTGEWKMKHSLLTSIPPDVKTKPGISLFGALILIGTVGFTQQVSALEVGPGSTAYFDSAESAKYEQTDDCDPTNQGICGADSTLTTAGAYAMSVLTTTKRARQSSLLIKPFSVPESNLGSQPENTVLDARVTGLVKWRGTLWSVDLSTLGMLTIPALGPTADAFIRVSLKDVTDQDEDKHFEVGNAAIADFHCDPVDRELGAEVPIPLVSDGVELSVQVGWCEEHSEDSFNFGAKVIQGHKYELQLTMICQAITGAAPTIVSACSFNPTPISYDLESELNNALAHLTDSKLSITIPSLVISMPSIDVPIDLPGEDFDFTVPIDVPSITIPETTIDFSEVLLATVEGIFTAIPNIVPSIDDGGLDWEYMTVTIDPDVTGLLRSAKNEILGQVGLVRDDIEIVRKGVGQSINLLHTPQGKRETPILDGYPDLCGDGDCGWGEGR